MIRKQRLTRADAETLLDGGVAGHPDLTALLDAAAAPASANELAVGPRVLAELRAAHLRPTPTARRRSMIKTALAQVIAAKFAASAAVAAAATGGIALAAATGNLPGPIQHAAHVAFAAPDSQHGDGGGTPSTDSTGDTTPATDTGSTDSTDPAGGDTSSSDSPTASTTPSPSLTGLCKAYQAGVGDNPGKALENPAFTVLITAAGGKDNVADFCVSLVGPAKTHSSDHPSGNPGEPTESHGRPTDLPTQATSHHDGSTETPGGHGPGDGGSGNGGNGGEPSSHGNGSTDHPTGPPSGAPTTG